MLARRFSSPSAFGPRTRSLVSLRRGGERERGGVVGQRACIRVARDAPRLGARVSDPLVAPAARARRRMAVAAKRGTRETRKNEHLLKRVGCDSARAAFERTRPKCAPSRGCFLRRATRTCVRRVSRSGTLRSRVAVVSTRASTAFDVSRNIVRACVFYYQLAEAGRFAPPFLLAFRVAFQSRREPGEDKKNNSPIGGFGVADLALFLQIQERTSRENAAPLDRNGFFPSPPETSEEGKHARAPHWSSRARIGRARTSRTPSVVWCESRATREPKLLSAARRHHGRRRCARQGEPGGRPPRGRGRVVHEAHRVVQVPLRRARGGGGHRLAPQPQRGQRPDAPLDRGGGRAPARGGPARGWRRRSALVPREAQLGEARERHARHRGGRVRAGASMAPIAETAHEPTRANGHGGHAQSGAMQDLFGGGTPSRRARGRPREARGSSTPRRTAATSKTPSSSRRWRSAFTGARRRSRASTCAR